MFDRLMEDFCQFDDFCQGFYPRWEARLLTKGPPPSKKRGPEAGLADSEIMTILVLYHSSHFKNFKTFYQGVVLRRGFHNSRASLAATRNMHPACSSD